MTRTLTWIIFLFVISVFSCKKEEPDNPIPSKAPTDTLSPVDTTIGPDIDSSITLFIHVQDTNSTPVPNNPVILYSSFQDWSFHENKIGTFNTDANGLLELDSLINSVYYFRIPNSNLNNQDLLFYSDSIGNGDSAVLTFTLVPKYSLVSIKYNGSTVVRFHYKDNEFDGFWWEGRNLGSPGRYWKYGSLGPNTIIFCLDKHSVWPPHFTASTNSAGNLEHANFKYGFSTLEHYEYKFYGEPTQLIDSIQVSPDHPASIGDPYRIRLIRDSERNVIQANYIDDWQGPVIIADTLDMQFDSKKNPLGLLPNYMTYLATLGTRSNIPPPPFYNYTEFIPFFRMPFALGDNNVISRFRRSNQYSMVGYPLYNSLDYPTEIRYENLDSLGNHISEFTLKFEYSH